ncbi:hypothetical protein ABK040_008984 [Willaertia magna]
MKRPYSAKSFKNLKFLKNKNNFFDKIFTKLSYDEWYSILNFLKIGEVILLAITCKDFYNKITKILQQYHPTVIYNILNNELINKNNKWTILNALRNSKKIIVNDNTLPQLQNLLVNQDLSKISDLYEIYNELINCNLKNITKLFSTETTNHHKRNIDVINLDLQDPNIEDNYYFYNNKKSIIVNDKIGFKIKNLSIMYFFQNGKQLELYSLLSQFCCLESLRVFYEFGNDLNNLNEINILNNHEINNELNNELNNYELNSYEINNYELNKSISVPIMYHLKNLNIDIQFDDKKKNKIVTDILQLVPNLETIKFDSHSTINDKLLNFIVKACPKLKVFDADEVETITTVTDKNLLNFLKELPNLKFLALRHCNNINGLFFKEIGKYGKNLEHLGITREFNEESEELENDLYFGGGELTNLESFYIDSDFEPVSDKFIESLFKIAPNLKKITGLYQFVKSFDKFNFKNLQSIEIEQKDFKKILEIINLKELTIRLGFERESFSTREILNDLLLNYPNLESLEYFNTEYLLQKRNSTLTNEKTKEALIEILKNPMNWPNLKSLKIYENDIKWEDLFVNKIVEIRPALKLHWSEMCKKSIEIKEQSEMEFTRFWLLNDEH